MPPLQRGSNALVARQGRADQPTYLSIATVAAPCSACAFLSRSPPQAKRQPNEIVQPRVRAQQDSERPGRSLSCHLGSLRKSSPKSGLPQGAENLYIDVRSLRPSSRSTVRSWNYSMER